VSLSEMKMQMPFSYETVQPVNGKTSWSSLGASNFTPGLNPAPMEANFKVNNAQMSTGELRLGLSKSIDIADTSRVAVSLNGAPLGYTKMDKSSKTVAFPFPAGTLMSGENTLTVTPTLTSTQNCASSEIAPSLLISAKSALIINTPAGSALDLGSFAAAGAPFSEASGALTDVYLTGNESARTSALQVLAKAAQTSGEGWTAAGFMTRIPGRPDPERNVLILGPLPKSQSAILAGAPRALQDAVRGRITTQTVKTASGSANDAFALAARQTPRAYKAKGTGIAAVYAAQETGSAIGIISAARPGDFKRLAAALISEPNWSNLSGSVSAWDKNSVTLLQAADSRLTSKQPKAGNSVGAIAQAVRNFNGAVSDRFSTGLTSLAALKPARPVSVKTPAARPTVSKPPVLRVSAPVQVAQTATFSPAVLRGRSEMPIATASAKLKAGKFNMPGFLDWSDFDSDYFKVNVTRKTTALLGNTASMKMPASATDLKQKFKALLSGDLKSKSLLLLLISVMALMLLGLAAPASSNKNIG